MVLAHVAVAFGLSHGSLKKPKHYDRFAFPRLLRFLCAGAGAGVGAGAGGGRRVGREEASGV